MTSCAALPARYQEWPEDEQPARRQAKLPSRAGSAQRCAEPGRAPTSAAADTAADAAVVAARGPPAAAPLGEPKACGRPRGRARVLVDVHGCQAPHAAAEPENEYEREVRAPLGRGT